MKTDQKSHAHTHTRLTALIPGQRRWAGTRKAKPVWILLKQETVSGSGISWAIYKSAPCSRQITMPAPHHSVFYRLDVLPAAQPTQFHPKAINRTQSVLWMENVTQQTRTCSWILSSWNRTNLEPRVCRYSRPPDLLVTQSWLGHVSSGMNWDEVICSRQAVKEFWRQTAPRRGGGEGGAPSFSAATSRWHCFSHRTLHMVFGCVTDCNCNL